MTPSQPSAKPFALRPHPHLYEISTWAWLEKLSTRTGRLVNLGDIPDTEWDALARLGFNAIWLMGVWGRKPRSRRTALADPANIPQYDRALPGWKPEDVVGSPYAVAGYVPDPRIGTWDELDSVREKLHVRGMALFLDFVGNHTALELLGPTMGGRFWSATYQPVAVVPDWYRATFATDRATFQRRDADIETRLEVTVVPDDAAEVRRLTLTNHGSMTREVEATSLRRDRPCPA